MHAMTDRSRETIEEKRPTLIGAMASFAATMVMVVLLVALTGRETSPEARAAATGTYVSTSPGSTSETEVTALSFSGPDTLEMKVGDRVFEAFYRVEGERVLIERIERGRSAGMWIFEIVGGRLVGPDVVLERAER
ncbi:hypothetical protein ASA1KI_02990 [Opitutales bacterium ASA1]|nr:hypothetical protein ASA1KI_02990 [Opitutales bacterium ASA1]